jgi:hypothetical protein
MTTKKLTDHHRYLADDGEHEKYSPVGVDGLLAATEKLLAVNRGLAEPDDRDSLPNDRIYTVDRLIAERQPPFSPLRSPQRRPQGRHPKSKFLAAPSRARPGKDIDETGLRAPVS